MVTLLVALITFVVGALVGYFLSGSSPLASEENRKSNQKGAETGSGNQPLSESTRKVIGAEAQDLLDIAIAQSISAARQSRDASDAALKAKAYDDIKSEWEQAAGPGGDTGTSFITLPDNPYSATEKAERPAKEAGRPLDGPSAAGLADMAAGGLAEGSGKRTADGPAAGLSDKLDGELDNEHLPQSGQPEARSSGQAQPAEESEDLESFEDLEEL